MSRHNILVSIDSPQDMSANQATSFVAGAIDTVRANYVSMQRIGMFGDNKFAETLRASVICTSLQAPMRERFVKDVGMEVQGDIEKLIAQTGINTTNARHLAQDIINLVMRSQLVHQDARAIYQAMPGEPA